MTDKKSVVVPTKPGAAGKLLLKMLAEKREKEVAEIKRNSEQGSCFVQCSTKPDKGYVMMMGIINDTATVYEIKPYHGGSSGSEKPVSTKNIRVGNFEIGEGVNANCPACGNAGRFVCQCGVYSCLPAKATRHSCPACKAKVNSFHTVSYINAGQSGGRSTSSKAGNTALPKGGSGLFLGRRK